eukprot:gene6532-7032_t
MLSSVFLLLALILQGQSFRLSNPLISRSSWKLRMSQRIDPADKILYDQLLNKMSKKGEVEGARESVVVPPRENVAPVADDLTPLPSTVPVNVQELQSKQSAEAIQLKELQQISNNGNEEITAVQERTQSLQIISPEPTPATSLLPSFDFSGLGLAVKIGAIIALVATIASTVLRNIKGGRNDEENSDDTNKPQQLDETSASSIAALDHLQNEKKEKESNSEVGKSSNNDLFARKDATPEEVTKVYKSLETFDQTTVTTNTSLPEPPVDLEKIEDEARMALEMFKSLNLPINPVDHDLAYNKQQKEEIAKEVTKDVNELHKQQAIVPNGESLEETIKEGKMEDLIQSLFKDLNDEDWNEINTMLSKELEKNDNKLEKEQIKSLLSEIPLKELVNELEIMDVNQLTKEIEEELQLNNENSDKETIEAFQQDLQQLKTQLKDVATISASLKKAKEQEDAVVVEEVKEEDKVGQKVAEVTKSDLSQDFLKHQTPERPVETSVASIAVPAEKEESKGDLTETISTPSEEVKAEVLNIQASLKSAEEQEYEARLELYELRLEGTSDTKERAIIEAERNAFKRNYLQETKWRRNQRTPGSSTVTSEDIAPPVKAVSDAAKKSEEKLSQPPSTPSLKITSPSSPATAEYVNDVTLKALNFQSDAEKIVAENAESQRQAQKEKAERFQRFKNPPPPQPAADVVKEEVIVANTLSPVTAEVVEKVKEEEEVLNIQALLKTAEEEFEARLELYELRLEGTSDTKERAIIEAERNAFKRNYLQETKWRRNQRTPGSSTVTSEDIAPPVKAVSDAAKKSEEKLSQPPSTPSLKINAPASPSSPEYNNEVALKASELHSDAQKIVAENAEIQRQAQEEKAERFQQFKNPPSPQPVAEIVKAEEIFTNTVEAVPTLSTSDIINEQSIEKVKEFEQKLSEAINASSQNSLDVEITQYNLPYIPATDTTSTTPLTQPSQTVIPSSEGVTSSVQVITEGGAVPLDHWKEVEVKVEDFRPDVIEINTKASKEQNDVTPVEVKITPDVVQSTSEIKAVLAEPVSQSTATSEVVKREVRRAPEATSVSNMNEYIELVIQQIIDLIAASKSVSSEVASNELNDVITKIVKVPYKSLQGIIERYPEGIASFVASDMKKYLKDEVEFFTLTILLKFFHYCQNDWKRFEQLLELEILPLAQENSRFTDLAFQVSNKWPNEWIKKLILSYGTESDVPKKELQKVKKTHTSEEKKKIEELNKLEYLASLYLLLKEKTGNSFKDILPIVYEEDEKYQKTLNKGFGNKKKAQKTTTTTSE